jgi:hypothetical protein
MEIVAEARQFFQVQRCELPERIGALRGEGQPDNPPVIGVLHADDKPHGLGALGQFEALW